MADMDAELAFLQAQREDQEYDPAHFTSAGVDQPVGDDEYDPTAVLATGPSSNEHSPSDQSASMPESMGITPEPAAGGALKPQPADATACTPSQQPRTKGGFVVESDDDDDDDEDEVPGSAPQAAGAALLNASGDASGSRSPQRSLSQTPNITLPNPPTNVPLHNAEDKGTASSSTSPIVNDTATAPVLASAVPNGGTPVSVPDPNQTGVPDRLNTASARPPTAPVTPATTTSLPKPRLPQDRVGMLNDRIAEDPRGDTEAWLQLIDEHRRRHKFDEARADYDRFFKIFPTDAEHWAEYVNMESDLEEFGRVERLFERSIMLCPHVELWSTYINYIRRRNNLTTDPQGNARQIITQVYKFVLDNVGIDPRSGKIWLEYIEFIKSGPGVVGGSTWQDMQKMDTLRKVYQEAIAIPTSATLEIWREYDKFELGLNKATGRKYLQEKSPLYMTARAANTQLENVIKGIVRTTVPKLPPVQGFGGYDEYMHQVKLWKAWIQWEKSDPLLIQDTDRGLMNKRIIYIYKHALMALRFWPELWYDAAEWAFENGLEKEGNEFLDHGIEANPESCLLAFRKAHQLELGTGYEDGEPGIVQKGKDVREPFNKVLDALYDLTAKTKAREEYSLARAKEDFAAQQAMEDAARANNDNEDEEYNPEEDDEEEAAEKRRKEKEEALDVQLKAISAGYNAQTLTLKKTISYAWINLMRTMRRIQGKGRPDPPAGSPPGFRGIFAEARKKGKLISDAYVASALIEHHCYQDPAATKIFDRGMKLFPDDENFALEYIKHLVKQNDATNARAVFETVVNRLIQKPESVARAKPLFVFFHEYESQFGELAQIIKLEKRMRDLYPEDPQLLRFAQRFTTTTFDPTTVRPIISPKTQMRPAMLNALPTVVPTVEEPSVAELPQVQELRNSPAMNSPRVPAALLPISNSPKRPFDDGDNELAQPRKMIRAESPLKGAAGRRLDAARRNLGRTSEGVSNLPTAPPAPLPREINFLLSIIPGAHTYNATRFSAEKLVGLLQTTDLARAPVGGRPGGMPQPPPQPMQMQMQPPVPTPVSHPPPMGWGPPPPGTMGYYGR